MNSGFSRRRAAPPRLPAMRGALGLALLLSPALGFGFGFGFAGPARADQGVGPLSVSGTLAASGQKSDRAGVAAEPNGELELDTKLPMGPGVWRAEILGSTTPPGRGVSRVFGEANGLAGETLSGSGEGRLAVTELFYTAPVARGHVRGGVLYAPDYLDTNDVADDEYRQFLGQSFIFDPIVDFPFYAPALEADAPIGRGFAVTALVSGSNGLENGRHTYADMLALDDRGHGAFAALESEWRGSGLSGNIGVWDNSGRHPMLANAGAGQDDFGIYGNLSGGDRALKWDLRAGLANPRVSPGANFVALALAYRLRSLTVGFGLARIGVSPDRPAPRAAVIQGELYLRVEVGQGIALGPDLQYLKNSNFDPAKGRTWIGGFRAAYEF